MSEAEFHEMQLQLQREIEETIQAARVRPITQDEAALLMSAAGIPKFQPKGNHETYR